MARTYRLGLGRRAINLLAKAGLRFGIAPKNVYVLTTVGRKSGVERSNPVQLVEHDGERWLVAPYGVVPWVLNARAAGRVALTRRGRTEDFEIDEVGAESAAPVLKRYLRIAPIALPYFDAKWRSPVEEFEREASDHPVFRLKPITRAQ